MNAEHLSDEELVRAGEDSDNDLSRELARRLDEALSDLNERRVGMLFEC